MKKYWTDEHWIGFDLDGTLIQFDGWEGPESFGQPIIPMMALIKHHIQNGQRAKIVTARASNEEDKEFVRIWADAHGLQNVEITDKKDYLMIKLYDDRAIQVEKNTGRIINE